MHDPYRVVEVLRRLALEYRLPLLEGRADEPHQLRDGGRLKVAVLELLQQLQAGLARRRLHGGERIVPRHRARALSPGIHAHPEKADRMAKIPSATIARPLTALIQATTPAVSRARSTDVPTASRHHQVAEPRSTPSTTRAGRKSEPP